MLAAATCAHLARPCGRFAQARASEWSASSKSAQRRARSRGASITGSSRRKLARARRACRRGTASGRDVVEVTRTLVRGLPAGCNGKPRNARPRDARAAARWPAPATSCARRTTCRRRPAEDPARALRAGDRRAHGRVRVRRRDRDASIRAPCRGTDSAASRCRNAARSLGERAHERMRHARHLRRAPSRSTRRASSGIVSKPADAARLVDGDADGVTRSCRSIASSSALDFGQCRGYEAETAKQAPRALVAPP